MRRAAFAIATGLALVLTSAGPAFADATRQAEWYATALRFDQLHAITQGAGVTVAVIDTGVDANHPDLRGNILGGVDAWSPAKDGHTDSSGHGTAMASLIAGHGHGSSDGILGVAPQAKILPVGAVPPGSGDFAPADLAAGIRWAVDHGANVISLSLSGGSDPAVEASIAYARDHKVALVAAAGNKPRDHSITFPAAYPGVIAVSATNRSGAFAADVSISDFGVLLAAPGADIIAAAPGGRYATASGTSSACAIVAGVAALIKAKYPELSGEQIYQVLKATAVDKGPPGHDVQYGYGLIDPLAALTRGPSALPSASTGPTAGPAAGPTDVAAPPVDEARSTTTKILLSLLLIAGYVLIAVLIVYVVVRVIRRRRSV